MLFRCLFLLVLLLTAHIAGAQNFKPGFIKLRGGANKAGLLGRVLPGEAEGIEYKANDSSAVEIYHADEIDGYKVTNGLNFTSYQYHSKWIFVELFVTGELSLLRKNYIFLLRKRDSFFFDSLGLDYAEKLRKLMRDCPEVASTSSKIRMDTSGVAAHVRAYNECIANKSTTHDDSPRQVSIALMIGYDNSSASFKEAPTPSTRFLTGGRIGDRSFLQAAVDLTFRSYKISHYFGFFVGAQYNPNRYHEITRIVYNRNQSSEVNEFSIGYNEVKIPVGLELMSPSLRKLKLHMRAGYTFRRMVKFDSSHPIYDTQPSNNGSIYSEFPGQVMSFKPTPSPIISLGLDYRVFEKSRIRLQLNASFGKVRTFVTDGVNKQDITGNFNSYGVMTGYVF